MILHNDAFMGDHTVITGYQYFKFNKVAPRSFFELSGAVLAESAPLSCLKSKNLKFANAHKRWQPISQRHSFGWQTVLGLAGRFDLRPMETCQEHLDF